MVSILKAIEARDPDGGERQPTTADYDAHEAWAVATYGREAWKAYTASGWDTAYTDQA